MDVAVHASQDSMPAGMAKVLEMIGSAMDLCSADGELYVSGTLFEAKSGEEVNVEVSYKTPGGLIDNKSLQVFERNTDTGANGETVQPSNKTRDSYFYKLKAGKSYVVSSSDNPARYPEYFHTDLRPLLPTLPSSLSPQPEHQYDSHSLTIHLSLQAMEHPLISKLILTSNT